MPDGNGVRRIILQFLLQYSVPVVDLSPWSQLRNVFQLGISVLRWRGKPVFLSIAIVLVVGIN